MSYLLDTNVVSALRVPHRHDAVARWAASVPVVEQYVAAFTIAEIERGVAAKERSDRAQGALLRRWFEEQVLPAFASRVLPFDLAAARMLAGYRVPERAPLDDAMLAAVAQANQLVFVTRNVKHIEQLGVQWFDPWTGRSSSAR